MLQGLPGVGPALANRLLVHFGSVERVITADQGLLAQVHGIGPKKAQRIRNVTPDALIRFGVPCDKPRTVTLESRRCGCF